MTDLPLEAQTTNDTTAPGVVVTTPLDPKAAVAVSVVAKPVYVPTPDLIAKLETILSALGHELPVFWNEAVALAKKAL